MSNKPTGKGLWSFIVNEAGYAVDDIRQKVVENPWFRTPVTPELNKMMGHDGTSHDDAEKGQSVGRDDLYGQDTTQPEFAEPANADWDNVRDVVNENARRNEPMIEHTMKARWESIKDQAEQLYGHDHEQARDDLEQDIER